MCIGIYMYVYILPLDYMAMTRLKGMIVHRHRYSHLLNQQLASQDPSGRVSWGAACISGRCHPLDIRS